MNRVVIAVTYTLAVAFYGCSRSADEGQPIGSSSAPLNTAPNFRSSGQSLLPNYPEGPAPLALVTLPSSSTDPITLTEVASETSLRIALIGAARKSAFVDEHVSFDEVFEGARWTIGVTHGGFEDKLHFAKRPSEEVVRYHVARSRLPRVRVAPGEVVEFLDSKGRPRLRAQAPYILTSANQRKTPRVSLSGCSESETDCTLSWSWAGLDVSYPAVFDPQWTSTQQPVTTGRENAAATVLLDGRVLVSSGFDNGYLATSELFDPDSGTWTASSNSAQPRALPVHVLLRDGGVLLVGGEIRYVGNVFPQRAGTNLLEVWTEAKGFQDAGRLSTGRAITHALMLPSGEVLIAGGSEYEGMGARFAYSRTSELYNPATGTVRDAGRIPTLLDGGVALGAMSFLPDGRVILVGGVEGTADVNENFANRFAFSGRAYIWNPATSSWSAGPPMSTGRELLNLLTLADGGLMAVGGNSGGQVEASSEVYSAASNTWSPGPLMTTARTSHRSAPLGNGSFVVTGGYNGAGNSVSTVDLYDHTTHTFKPGPPMLVAVGSHIAASLPNGRVLAAYGFSAGVFNQNLRWSEVLTAIPNGLACTNALDCISGVCTDGVCCNTACTGTCRSCLSPRTGIPSGICGDVVNGGDPDNECSAEASTSCGMTGACASDAGCAYFDPTTVCAYTCPNFAIETRCNGRGLCNLAGNSTACSDTVCTTATGCSTSTGCTSAPKLNGTACPAGECQAGACVAIDAGSGGGAGGGGGSDAGAGGGSGGDAGTGGGSGSSTDLFACSAAPIGAPLLLVLFAAALLLRRRGAVIVALLLALATTAQAQTQPAVKKIAVTTLSAGPGTDPKLVDFLTDTIVGAIQQRGYSVVGPRDIATIIGFERQKQLMGCGEASSCVAELAGALGADHLVSGSVGKLGESLVMNLQLIDAATGAVVSRSTQRLKSTAEDAYLDAAEDGVSALFPQSGAGKTGISGGKSDVSVGSGFSLSAREQIRPMTPLSAAAAVFAGYRINNAVTVGAGALIHTKMFGVSARATFVPVNSSGAIQPIVGVEVPVLFSGGALFGAGAVVGVQYVPTSFLAIGLEVPVNYYFNAPDGFDKLYVFLAPTITVRL